MPNMGDRGKMMEHNNHKSGRSGGKVKQFMGPAVGKAKDGNPTKGGGINRSTQGTRQN